MWFAAVWLLGAGVWRDRAGGRSILSAPAEQLLNLFGVSGRLVAISVVCLLVGEVTSVTAQSMLYRRSWRYMARITPENLAGLPGGWRGLFRPISRRAINRLYTNMIHAYEAVRPPGGGAEVPGSEESERMAIRVLNEVLTMGPRLIMAKPELYAEYDRIRSESEFRDAILVPLPILGTAISLNLHVPTWVKVVVFLAVVVLDVYLFLQARRLFRTAHSIVAHSIADGTVSSATMGDLGPG
jgi:hypothetical protein